MSHTNPQIKQILKLNRKFYQSVSKDFSSSRNLPWKGWERATKIFFQRRADIENIKILDLGCGNGRFAGYLLKKAKVFTYKGYDTNNDLLSEAKEKYKTEGDVKIKFARKDVLRDLHKIKSRYDLVVCFGVTHHIPDSNFRTKWFTSLIKLLNKNGLLVLTFWEFEQKPGDYLVSWDTKESPRYCHQYSQAELEKIKAISTRKGLKLMGEYESDNKNRYLIFGNI